MKIALRVYIAALLSMMLWGSAFVAIRVGLVDYSPGALALLRFGVASICIYLMLKSKGQALTIPWRSRLMLMGIGVIGITIYHTALNTGEVSTSAGVTSFVMGLMPVFTLLLSVFFLKERPCPYATPGVLLSLLGLFIIMRAEGQPLALSGGILFILMAAMAGAIQTVTQKQFLHQHHPIEVSAWVIWGGTLVLCCFSQSLYQEWSGVWSHASLAGIYLGIFPAAIAYILWGYVLRYLPASTASMYFYSLPIFSTVLGYVLLHEVPSFLSMIGGVLAVLGAILAQKKKPFTFLDEQEASPTHA